VPLQRLTLAGGARFIKLSHRLIARDVGQPTARPKIESTHTGTRTHRAVCLRAPPSSTHAGGSERPRHGLPQASGGVFIWGFAFHPPRRHICGVPRPPKPPEKPTAAKLRNWRVAIMRARAHRLGIVSSARPQIGRSRSGESVRPERGSAQAPIDPGAGLIDPDPKLDRRRALELLAGCGMEGCRACASFEF
jgi:hypothetical protein